MSFFFRNFAAVFMRTCGYTRICAIIREENSRNYAQERENEFNIKKQIELWQMRNNKAD